MSHAEQIVGLPEDVSENVAGHVDDGIVDGASVAGAEQSAALVDLVNGVLDEALLSGQIEYGIDGAWAI